MSTEDDLRHTRSDRAVRRRTLMIAAAVAAAAGIAAAVVASPMDLRRDSDDPAAAAGSAVTAAPAPSAPPPLPAASPPPAVRWTKPDFALPVFPLTPGWTPGGLGTPAVGIIGSSALLQYDIVGSSYVEVEIGPEPGEWHSEGEEDHRAQVGPATATVRTSSSFDGATGPADRYVAVRWQLPDRRWVQVASWGPRTEEDVLRYARGLRVRPQAGDMPFTFAEVPRGLKLQHLTYASACLAPPGKPVREGRGLCVGFETSMDEGVPVTVGGRRAVLRPDGSVAVDFGGDRILWVHTDPAVVPMSPADLIRFAEGTTPR